MGSQLPEEAGPRLRLERPSEHVAVVVIDAPAVPNALSGRFLGEEVSGTEAELIGLVNKAVPDEDLMPEALRWAATIADRPRRGVRATLGFLQLQADMSKQEAMRGAALTPGYMGMEL